LHGHGVGTFKGSVQTSSWAALAWFILWNTCFLSRFDVCRISLLRRCKAFMLSTASIVNTEKEKAAGRRPLAASCEAD
jgi:hypothetical protein